VNGLAGFTSAGSAGVLPANAATAIHFTKTRIVKFSFIGVFPPQGLG
jgi:hypothetical protein